MSTASENSRFSGNQLAKSPEKSSTFSMTCNLLSQYLKDNKGTFNMKRTLQTNASPATTMELFPTKLVAEQDAYPRQSEVPTLVNSSAFKTTVNEPKAAQLTIFYDGKVVVFDDFPAEKVKEIMSYAGNQINNYASGNKIQPSIPQGLSRPIVRDLPIARKVSLHRFLEKRKDRISSKAPYQMMSNQSSALEKPAESISWLGLGATPTQI